MSWEKIAQTLSLSSPKSLPIVPLYSPCSSTINGWLAQVVECLLWVQEAGGSSPSSPFSSKFAFLEIFTSCLVLFLFDFCFVFAHIDTSCLYRADLCCVWMGYVGNEEWMRKHWTNFLSKLPKSQEILDTDPTFSTSLNRNFLSHFPSATALISSAFQPYVDKYCEGLGDVDQCGMNAKQRDDFGWTRFSM